MRTQDKVLLISCAAAGVGTFGLLEIASLRHQLKLERASKKRWFDVARKLGVLAALNGATQEDLEQVYTDFDFQMIVDFGNFKMKGKDS